MDYKSIAYFTTKGEISAQPVKIIRIVKKDTHNPQIYKYMHTHLWLVGGNFVFNHKPCHYSMHAMMAIPLFMFYNNYYEDT